MKYVYTLRSLNFPGRYYTGITSDINKRLAEHNSGKSSHTSKYKPWTLIYYTCFAVDEQATKFEKYLKTGSGIAFSKKHFR